MEKVWVLQYRGTDGTWFDESGYALNGFEDAKLMYESLGRRGTRWQATHRIVERSDRVVWPVEIDPASAFSA